VLIGWNKLKRPTRTHAKKIGHWKLNTNARSFPSPSKKQSIHNNYKSIINGRGMDQRGVYKALERTWSI
jgi:hypothetical protein